jgi:hypothetical protein
LGEVVHLADERRYEQSADRDDAEHRADEDDADRQPSAADPPCLQPVDGGVQRHREEERDRSPDQNVAGDPQDAQHQRRPEDDGEDDKDGPGPEVDEATLHAGRGYESGRSGPPTARCVVEPWLTYGRSAARMISIPYRSGTDPGARRVGFGSPGRGL